MVLGVLAFWGLRIAYWRTTFELPFSDMEDYVRVARGVLASWDFRFDSFWVSYKPPGLPILLAAVFGVVGEESQAAWRWAQAAFTFAALLWLCCEVARASGRRWMAPTLLLCAALCRASIFWSYKISTEGPAEAFSYLGAACILLCFRRPRLDAFFLTGVVLMAAVFNRPQGLAVVFAFPVVYLLQQAWHFPGLPNPRAFLRKRLPLLVAMGLGVALVWTPWLVRSYGHYGRVLPLTSQGPYSFLWELGEVEYEAPDGTVVRTDWQRLQAEAITRFKSDYDAQAYAGKIMSQWLARNPWTYAKLVVKRFFKTLGDRTEYLTKVPRERLFSGVTDWFLIDKVRPLTLLGALGLLGMSLWAPGLVALPLIALGQWFFGLLFLGYSRILDPTLALVLFGNAFWVVLLIERLGKVGILRRS